MEVEGANGYVVVETSGIVIKRKRGLLTLLNQGIQGDKSIPYSSITAIQLRDPGAFSRGYIRFSISGRDPVGGLMEATSDENAVLIDRNQIEGFQKLKVEIEARMGAERARSSPQASGGDAISELERLAGLVERGFVTRDEFEARKKLLLASVR